MKSLILFGTSTRSYFETYNIYFEDDRAKRNCVQRAPIFISMPIAFTLISSLIVDQHPIATTDDEPIKDIDQ